MFYVGIKSRLALDLTFQIPGRLNFTVLLEKIDFYMRGELKEKMEAAEIRFPTVEVNNWQLVASQPATLNARCRN